MGYRKEQYDAYLLTNRWLLELRPQRLNVDNHRCRLCNESANYVHHRVYPEVLGTETIDDLTSLCDTCHVNFHFPPGIKEVSLQTIKMAKTKAIRCPCCCQVVKFYKRSLTSSMAAALMHVHRYFEKNDADEWLHVEDYLKQLPISSAVRGDYGKLVHFKTLAGESLLIKKMGLREDGSDRNGYWKITSSGRAFVLDKVRVPKWVRLYCNKVYDVSGELIGIKDALRKQFDYKELLNA